MSGEAVCSCGHIESAHRKMTDPACLAPTGYAFGAFSFGCRCRTFEAVSQVDQFPESRNTAKEATSELHDSSMFSAAVKDTLAAALDESSSERCVNTGVSAPIVSPPIVSTPALALRSAPILGSIADGYTGCEHGFTPECTFCWNERRRSNGQSTVDTAEAYRNQDTSDTVTITISREDAEGWASKEDHIHAIAWGPVDKAIRAALEGER